VSRRLALDRCYEWLVNHSRRGALRALAAGFLAACESSHAVKRSAEHGAPDPAATRVVAAASDVPRLAVVELGTAVPGDDALVLLHGWGARGDDLVSLGRELARPKTTIVVPAGPLAEGSGRAWWHFDPNAPRAYAASDEVPAGHQPLADVVTARAAVRALLDETRARLAPPRVALAGFSQGAMLSLDVALECDARVERVAVLSGALLLDSLPALLASCAARPRVLVTHGRFDPIVPFRNAERAVAILEEHGLRVDFRPFDGKHAIPAEVRNALPEFLFGA
jgi:phospholipase/carboxylesterase